LSWLVEVAVDIQTAVVVVLVDLEQLLDFPCLLPLQ
jgi:hypothetical protein